MLDTKGNKITFFGHATFSLTTRSGEVGLIDPFVMSNPKCPEALKKLPRLDAIFVSHAHADHFADLVPIAKQHRPQIAAIFETCLWLGTKGLEKEARPMSKGGTQKIGDFEVTMTHAFHSNGIEDGDKVVYGGEPAGLVIRMSGGFTVYHAGDTALFGDMKLIGELYKPDIALLPIGDLFTMGPRDAAYALRLLGVKHAVPMHYGTFSVLSGTAEAFQHEARDIAGLEIHVLKPGDSL
jgi:L-ascorbate metabolism protein UlaG (beta-lactamase superfamily)